MVSDNKPFSTLHLPAICFNLLSDSVCTILLLPDTDMRWYASFKSNPVKYADVTKFILPGVTAPDALAHLCRTQARKVERFLIELKNQNVTDIPIIIFMYMNRVSDFFFVFARWICQTSGKPDCFV